MTKDSGFYSLVQFCPDPFRGEGINVGVIVGCEAKGILRPRFADTNERVRRHFRGLPIDDGRLTSAKAALARRIADVKPTEADLLAFSKRESSQLVISPPRKLLVEDVNVEVDRLFSDFVEEPRTFKPEAVCLSCGSRMPALRERSVVRPEWAAAAQMVTKFELEEGASRLITELVQQHSATAPAATPPSGWLTRTWSPPAAQSSPSNLQTSNIWPWTQPTERTLS